ncbi:hypothetical protein [Bacillus sp. FJAT-29814]|uniref:hypothetical protein n=1 Tax=Bacillus sp. FJAT-29814 TaxID=1729688 RepID=UPI00083129FC|nr:hypothetical protein [Bacillus sp. FJAT-29814]
MGTIEDSLRRDYYHFKDQLKILEESICLGEILHNNEEWTYARSLKEEYFNKMNELLGYMSDFIVQKNDIEKELKNNNGK